MDESTRYILKKTHPARYTMSNTRHVQLVEKCLSRHTRKFNILITIVHVIHAQLFWHVLEGETHVKAGTPLIQYIPMHRKYLQNSNFETIIDSAGDVEWQMEESFEYANQSQFIAEDTVQNRLNRVMTVFNKYRNKGFKL